MHSLSNNNPFPETVKDEGVGGGCGPLGGYGVVVLGLCQRGRFQDLD